MQLKATNCSDLFGAYVHEEAIGCSTTVSIGLFLGNFEKFNKTV